MPSPSAFALVVEPDRRAASELAELLFTEGISCAVAESGVDAWHGLATRRPDLILIALGAPALDTFHRRLRDEYFGQRPRLIGVGDAAALDPSVRLLELDAVLLRPVTSTGVFSAMVGLARPLQSVSLDVGRVLELLKLSCLGIEIQRALDRLVHRLALVYGVPRCSLVATASERTWVASVGAPAEEDWQELLLRCEQAVHAGAPLFISSPRMETRLAVPIPSQGGAILGAIALSADGALLFSPEARDALADLAARIGMELSWQSVHDRMVAERDHLRETAMLDPMLGVLARGALEQAMATEIARVDESREPLALAVIDVHGLRHINDRYGHIAGDAALRHIANVARRLVRPHDIVGRSGDDEIAVLFPSTQVPAATAVLDRVRRAVETEPFQVEGSGPLHVRVGIGVTEHGASDEDGAVMLARAARTASVAGQRGAIAIADRAPPSAETRPNLLLDRYDAGVTLGGMYQIVHEISRGAMGVVYRAEDLGLSRPVALKMLRPDLVRDVDVLRRFRDEAAILAAINQEHLVRVYSFVEDRDDVFFVMELVEGVSLDNHISELAEEGQHVPTDRAASIVAQVASALDAMHKAGVMHRDVKPGNVVLDRTRDRAVLVDVGLARRLGDKAEPAGTPGYIAPESFSGDPESSATDVYGLAATTYAMLTAHAPFGRADDYREILRRQLDESPLPPSALRADLPPAVDEVLLRGMAQSSQDRYQTAGEMARALEAALGDLTTETSEEPTRQHTQTQFRIPSPGSRPNESKGSLTADLPLSPSRAAVEPMTRGIVFRSVRRVLGVRAATAWIQTVERTDQDLADALSLRTAPTAWIPAEHFFALFPAIAASGRNAHSFARELGSHVVEQSFRRFYQSAPESLSPDVTLPAIDILWRRYHTWGGMHLADLKDGAAVVRYDGPHEPPLCAYLEGWLESVLTMSGGTGASVSHPRCAARGAPHCDFDARWT